MIFDNLINRLQIIINFLIVFNCVAALDIQSYSSSRIWTLIYIYDTSKYGEWLCSHSPQISVNLNIMVITWFLMRCCCLWASCPHWPSYCTMFLSLCKMILNKYKMTSNIIITTNQWQILLISNYTCCISNLQIDCKMRKCWILYIFIYIYKRKNKLTYLWK